MPPTRLWVGNVPYNSTQDELETLFLRHGKITNISYREGFSFIDFETEDEAHEAKSKLHDTNYQGRRLQVEFARSDGPRARGERHDGPPPEDESGSRHLYVARIPEAVSVDELRDFFAVNGNGVWRLHPPAHAAGPCAGPRLRALRGARGAPHPVGMECSFMMASHARAACAREGARRARLA